MNAKKCLSNLFTTIKNTKTLNATKKIYPKYYKKCVLNKNITNFNHTHKNAIQNQNHGF